MNTTNLFGVLQIMSFLVMCVECRKKTIMRTISYDITRQITMPVVQASKYEYTFLASIESVSEHVDDEKEFVCGGTIIHILWVVTSAECFDATSSSRSYLVHGGIENINKHLYEQSRNASDIVIHPYYDSTKVENNIAMVKVSAPFKKTDFVNIAALPSHPISFTANENCYIIVHGYVVQSRYRVFSLIKIKLKSMDYEDCQEKLVKEHVDDQYPHFTNNTFCLTQFSYYPFNETQGACGTDVGYSCICRSQFQGYIASADSNTCDLEDNPRVPTPIVDVAVHQNWIFETVLELNKIHFRSCAALTPHNLVIRLLLLLHSVYLMYS